jgi:outer membrane receptor protein involved in Fe transport
MRTLDRTGSPTFDNPGYAIASIGASFRLPMLTITARVNNLFDRAYEEAFGYPALGRSAMIGVRVTAGR